MKGQLLHDHNVYVSFDAAPFDEVTIPDGDNSLLQIKSKAKGLYLLHLEDAPNIASEVVTPARVVPLPRKLKINDKGVDVRALQRALSRAGYRKWGFFSNDFGPGTLKQVKKFQHDHGIVASGVYGEATHAKLKSYFDLYGTSLMIEEQKRLYVKTPSGLLLSAAMLAYNNRNNIAYTQGPLRMYGVTHKIKTPNYPPTGDCSSLTTWYYYTSGLKDPNDLNFDGEGFTGTECLHGFNVPLNALQIGDLLFYGRGYPYEHVTIYVGNGRCVSHGSQIGPLLLPINYRNDLKIARRYLVV